jgi:hypothetical protein
MVFSAVKTKRRGYMLKDWGLEHYILPAVVLIFVGMRISFFVYIRWKLKPDLEEARRLPWPNRRIATAKVWMDWIYSVFRNLKDMGGRK